jgi:hypothetical protein
MQAGSGQRDISVSLEIRDDGWDVCCHAVRFQSLMNTELWSGIDRPSMASPAATRRTLIGFGNCSAHMGGQPPFERALFAEKL